MIGRVRRTLTLAAVLIGLLTSDAFAQAKPRPRRPPPPPLPPPTLEIGGYAMVGVMNFAAADSFDVTLGSPSGTIFGGGARVGLPFGGLFVDVGAWRFRGEGERAFVFEGQEFTLGIPMEVTITPLELTAGWQFRLRRVPKLRPYLGGGFSSYGYTETSEAATDSENIDERFSGYHLLGGAEYRISRWVSLSGEGAWTTIPDALGDAGVSAAFDETDLGGTSFRFKVTIGR
jgi:opacity protein-like surface antigen